MAAPMAAPPPIVAAVRLPREVPTCWYSLLASAYDLPWNSIRTNSRPSSLRPLMCPAERACTSLMYTSVPEGTTMSPSKTIGPSSEALKISPLWLTIDSIDSEVNHSGEIFKNSLHGPTVVDGDSVVPSGPEVYIKRLQARSAGHMSGLSEHGLERS